MGLWDLWLLFFTRMLGLGRQHQALLKNRIQKVSCPGNCHHLQPSAQLPCKTKTYEYLQQPGAGWGQGLGIGGGQLRSPGLKPHPQKQAT